MGFKLGDSPTRGADISELADFFGDTMPAKW